MEQSNHITMNDRSPSQSFNRYVDQCVQDWMSEHAIGLETADGHTEGRADYEVAFFDEDADGEISCLVILRDGEHYWRSWEAAANAKQALSLCLERLRNDLSNVQTH